MVLNKNEAVLLVNLGSPKNLDKKSVKQYLKVLANIAFGTSANIGGEMDVTELEKIIDSTDALRLSLFDVFGDFTDDDAAVAAP